MANTSGHNTDLQNRCEILHHNTFIISSHFDQIQSFFLVNESKNKKCFAEQNVPGGLNY